MDAFSLADDLSERWYAATDLGDLIEQAEEILTRRHLVLFRASCCATLLNRMDEPLCNEAVIALEHLPDHWNYIKHNEVVLRMLREVPILLHTESIEAAERLESWIRQDLPGDAAALLRQARGFVPPDPATEELLQAHRVISSIRRSITANGERHTVMDCIYKASISIAAWDLQDEIAATLRQDRGIAWARARFSHLSQQFHTLNEEGYQRLHCDTFREIVPGPEFGTDNIEPWRQPAVLTAAYEIATSHNFLGSSVFRCRGKRFGG